MSKYNIHNGETAIILMCVVCGCLWALPDTNKDDDDIEDKIEHHKNTINLKT